MQLAFKVRQDYITEHLCENRDRPELECHGHCQLSKMMQEAQQKREEQQAALLEVLLAFSVILPFEYAPAPPAEQPLVFAEADYAALPIGNSSDVFRPPRVA